MMDRMSAITLGASAGETTIEELKLLGVVALLMAIALFATNRRTLALRRSRAMVVLISGGWLAVGFGVLLGRGGLGVVGAENFRTELTPALQAALGWVGLMLGLQLRRDVITGLPRWVWRVVALDALLVSVVFAGGSALCVWLWLGDWDVAGVWWGVSVLACACAGWAVETRSLAGADAENKYETARVGVRAGGTLSAVVFTLVFGMLLAIGARGVSGEVEVDVLRGLMTLGAAFGGAGLIALVGRYALVVAGKSPEQRLAIFLGLVTLSAGFAGQLGLPALMVAMVTGVVLANLSEQGLRDFERFILNADLVIATLVALLAGILIASDLGVREVALGCAIAGIRLVLKPLVLQHGRPKGAALGALSIAPVRQSPVALAIALSALLIEPSGVMARLLGVVVVAGVVSAILPALLSWLGQRTASDRGVAA